MIFSRCVSPRPAKCCSAIFTAASTPSEPPLVRWMWCRPSGSQSRRSRSDSASRCGVRQVGTTKVGPAVALAIASATSRRPWPMLVTMAPPAASRMRLPSSAISQAPSPPVIRGERAGMNGQSVRSDRVSVSDMGRLIEHNRRGVAVRHASFLGPPLASKHNSGRPPPPRARDALRFRRIPPLGAMLLAILLCSGDRQIIASNLQSNSRSRSSDTGGQPINFIGFLSPRSGASRHRRTHIIAWLIPASCVDCLHATRATGGGLEIFSTQDLLANRRNETFCLEDLYSISVAQLHAHRSTAGNPPPPRHPLILEFECYEDHVLFNSQGLLPFGSVTVRIVRRKHGIASRILFVCPVTKREVSRLYFVPATVASRHACEGIPYASQILSKSDRFIARHNAVVAQIRGSEGRDPARGKRLRRFIKQLKATPYRDELWPHDALIVDYAERHQPRDLIQGLIRRERARRRPESATDRAIEYDIVRNIHPYPQDTLRFVEGIVGESFVEQHRKSLSQGPRRDWPGLLLPRGALEDHETIDVRVLQRRGLLRPGEATAWTMYWAPQGFPEGGGYLVADLRQPTTPHLRVVYVDRSQRTGQVIGLRDPASSRRRRWMFIDPASLEPCEVLALRGGLFARRQSQRLVNASQIRGRGRKCRETIRSPSASP